MRKKPISKALVDQIVPSQIRKGDLRKIEIVQAAIVCLAHQGFTEFSYGSVAKQIKTGKSHVAYHFPELRALIESALKYVYAIGQGIVAEHLELEKEPRHWLRSYITGTFQWMESHPDFAAVTSLLGYLNLVDPSYRPLQEEIRKLAVKRIVAMIAPISQKRNLTSAQLTLQAEMVHAFIIGRLLYFLANPKAYNRGQFIDLTVKTAEKLI